MSSDTARPAPAAAPLSPMLVVHPDRAQGTLRVRGRLDELGAELLLDNLEALQRLGHRRITVRIEPPATAPAARALLADLTDRLAAAGVLVVIA